MQKNENFAKQAEQAEVEVVARVMHSNPVVLDQCAPLNANDELMTVAQHAASVGRWAEMFNRVEQERDAALARAAELELKLDQSDYAYDNDRHHMRGMAKQAAEAIQVFTGHDSGANLAHRYGEKWWEHLDELRDALLAFAKSAPVAQAQHSVPEKVRTLLSRAQCEIEHLAECLENVCEDEEDFDVREDVADGRVVAADIAHMLAAAPDKEVPQAWLDVQAERRRQINAEGWTPEHDDAHSYGQMARAAACYALAGSSAPNDGTAALLVSLAWPWDEQWWKPTSARRDLVKACALTLAEIERLDRAAAPGEEVGHE